MSVPADFLQQYLGGLLNTPQPSGITSGLLSGNDPTTNLGLQLLANSNSGGHFGQIFGKSALDTQQQGMQNAMNRLQLAQGAVGLGATLQKQQAIMDYLGGSPNTPGSTVPAAISQPPSPQQPLGQPQATVQTDQIPQQLAAASQSAPSDISQIPINGIPAQTYKRLAVLMGKDPLTAEKETYERQLQIAQDQVRPQISALDTVAKSDKPTQYVAADPQLHKLWNQVAPTLGFNPATDFTDGNVRTVMNSARNKLAARVNLGEEAPIVPEQTINGALGSIYQKNPVTGAIKQVKGEEELKQVIDPKTGQPVLVPASKATGMQPFNASMFGAANMSDQALQFAADTYRTTGKMPAAFGRSPAMQAKVLEKVASDAAANGDTAGAIAARQGALKANGMALDMNQKKLAVIEPAVKKLDLDLQNLLNAAKAAGGTQSPLVNRAIRAWQQGVKGDRAVAQLVVHLNAVEGEYAKLNSGGTGAAAPSVSVRKEAHDAINKYMSEGTLEAAGQAITMDGQNALKVLRDERDSLTSSISGNAPGSGGIGQGQSQKIGGFTVTRVK